jgi:hypothetical protein
MNEKQSASMADITRIEAGEFPPEIHDFSYEPFGIDNTFFIDPAAVERSRKRFGLPNPPVARLPILFTKLRKD